MGCEIKPNYCQVPKQSHVFHLESDRIAVIVVCLRLAVSGLVMQGHSVVIGRAGLAGSTSKAVVVRAHAWATTKILHLRLRAGTACEIGIAANGSKVRSRSSVLVVRSVAAVVIRGRLE